MARVVVGVGISALAFAGVMLAPRTAHAQRVYVYSQRPPPPPPAYGYGYGGGGGYYGRPAQPYYYQEPPYALQLGFDLEGVAPVNPPTINGSQAALGGGVGFKVRVGEQFRFPGIRFTPEVGYGFDHIWASDIAGANGFAWDMNRVFAGARLGFGRIIVPVIYAHAGYGWRQTDATYITGGNGGLAFDVGGAIDFRVVPHFGFGVHLEYSQITTDNDQPQWVAVGGHADLIF
jgi:hypothetical protein